MRLFMMVSMQAPAAKGKRKRQGDGSR